ncbi:very short patch repair endonuclease [Variovorax sp. EL159]|uniref:very short patch repair endonuclease n=1 Tax=Variovorax sp. EL159 TaxID=1566270 RepID=UPI00088E75E8|nr:very short patch repair endonuclease [Variovorax sp. EL159]SCX59256.1 T/G mismatch-specific endonuclease [Variovorax sp. EL159]
MDIVDSATRSRMMSGIRGRDTKIEMVVRKALHARGLRYRLNNRSLPGRPDIAFMAAKAAVLMHGCFWHGHDCSFFRLPASNTEFWREKIDANRARDARTLDALHALGWRTATIWECAIRGRPMEEFASLLDCLENWVRVGAGHLELRAPMGAALPRPEVKRAQNEKKK